METWYHDGRDSASKRGFCDEKKKRGEGRGEGKGKACKTPERGFAPLLLRRVNGGPLFEEGAGGCGRLLARFRVEEELPRDQQGPERRRLIRKKKRKDRRPMFGAD